MRSDEELDSLRGRISAMEAEMLRQSDIKTSAVTKMQAIKPELEADREALEFELLMRKHREDSKKNNERYNDG